MFRIVNLKLFYIAKLMFILKIIDMGNNVCEQKVNVIIKVDKMLIMMLGFTLFIKNILLSKIFDIHFVRLLSTSTTQI